MTDLNKLLNTPVAASGPPTANLLGSKAALVDLKLYNPEQSAAILDILRWLEQPLAPNGHFYVLRGFAGTGKTFCMQALIAAYRGRIVFTAPTNKATKVLREVLASDDYKPECRTIYSLLGLQLSSDGEVRELLKPDKPLDLTQFRCIVVDEASMVGTKLMPEVQAAALAQGLRFLFLGDPAQLPPVKEITSPIWKLADAPQSLLSTVVRHDNTILQLATAIRQKVDHPAPSIRIASANDGIEGVWKLDTYGAFVRQIHEAAVAGRFQSNDAKAIAWRNTTVDDLNTIIRRAIFEYVQDPWVESDRVIFTAPAKNLDDEIIATTDDEGLVTAVREDWHPVWPEFRVFEVSVSLDAGGPVLARVLHPSSAAAYAARKEQFAVAARAERRKWPQFYEFQEAFHSLRHAYAITAHRSQGSTYKDVYIHAQDILVNRSRQEAFRCLYVACTRAQKREFILA